MRVELNPGMVLAARIGAEKRNVLFYRITERTGDKIRLQPLTTGFTIKGNPFPLDVDRTQKPFLRKINADYGSEHISGIIIGQLACGLRPWYRPKNLMGRGGHRVGAGRKKGSGKGRTVLTKSITLTTEEWAQIEYLRGSTGRSEYIRSLVFPPAKKVEK